MEIVKTFGSLVSSLSVKNPNKARLLLRTGWQAQNLKFKYLPDKRLMPADQYLAVMMMNMMIAPLRDPEHSSIVSIFTPCELLQEAGLNPYNVEAMSCYLAASWADRPFIQQAENDGISDTLCSYHKTFIGAAECGLLPTPRCIIYTTLACDANLVTFRYLANLYNVPSFCIDVPMQQTDAGISYVADQLRDLSVFLEDITGKHMDDNAVRLRVCRSNKTVKNFQQFQKLRSDRYVPNDLVTPLYSGMTNNIMLGTAEEEYYTELLLRDVASAPRARGLRIYWMHTIPYWSSAVKERLAFSDSAQIVGCEMGEPCDMEFDVSDPYRAMAGRMVYHGMNGGVSRRIEAGIKHAKNAGADGAVWFCHWGCKHTLGAAQLAKKKFEESGIPLLILDGDGCDRSHGGEGQTSTRLGAFLEMLGGSACE